MFKEIKPEELYEQKANHTIVDVRSPKEFCESTIPGSVNIPVFTDHERIEVGTIYKQVGPEAAKERGLEIFSRKLPDFIASFQKIDTPITVFCWRGGMRSKTAATVVDLMGTKIRRLTGGIRAYRNWTVDVLENPKLYPELIVLNGHSGVGKTRMLEKIEQKGYPVIHLEKMAGHRGSIFGQIGLEPHNQRMFDFLLAEKLLEFQDKPYVFIEGESKRIGKVTLPELLYEKKATSRQLFVSLPLDKRVETILEDYQPHDNPEAFMEAFHHIKKRIHAPVAREIEECLGNGEFAVAVELLLTHYYDPRYNHSTSYPEATQMSIEAGSIDEAVKQIEESI